MLATDISWNVEADCPSNTALWVAIHRVVNQIIDSMNIDI